jgi:hypothetical protein
MHKRLMDPVLQSLDASSSAYFADIAADLDGDDRLSGRANLVFLFLAAAVPYLPTQLPKRDFIGRLLAFHERNEHRIFCTAYDPAFVSDRDIIKPVVEEFVQEITAIVLKRLDDGTLPAAGHPKTYRLGWPIDPAAFPYAAMDDEVDEP